MMKIILSLILVLAIGSVASAGTAWLEVDASDAATSYTGSDIITINLVSDSDVTGVSFALGSDGGTASAPLFLHVKINAFPNTGTIRNSGGVLIDQIAGQTALAFPPQPVPAGEVIYSFEFHVPEGLNPSDIITIDDLRGDNEFGAPYATQISFLDFSTTDDIGYLEIHVPEPATIALLGFGALSLLRRRRKA